MGARLMYTVMILLAGIAGSLGYLWLQALLLARIANGKGCVLQDYISDLYFPQMENKRAEADNRDCGHDRGDHLPQ
ncbi:MAG: hypothetical protein IJC44_00105 [Clostridia bacterium]|nr:hypothetical protein [Clostridia bacterium]MBQ3090909.1 hypothetical protein [Clostridia bacterium]